MAFTRAYSQLKNTDLGDTYTARVLLSRSSLRDVSIVAHSPVFADEALMLLGLSERRYNFVLFWWSFGAALLVRREGIVRRRWSSRDERDLRISIGCLGSGPKRQDLCPTGSQRHEGLPQW